MCQSNPYSWFRLNHDITRHPYFRNANLFQFFIYLLDRAAVRDEEGLERGCVRISVRSYSKEFQTPESSVRHFIKKLSEDGAVEILNTSKGTGVVLRMSNYDKYQSTHKEDASRTELRTELRTDSRTELRTELRTPDTRKTPLNTGAVSGSENYDSRTELRTELRTDSRTELRTFALARNTNPRVLEEALEAKEEKEKREINLSQKERKESAAKAAAAEAARETKARFVPPSLSEVEAYALEKGAPEEASTFWNFYESKNWMVGKNKMQKWRNAFSGWLSRRQRNQISNTYRHEATDNTPLSRAEQREAERIQREQGVARLVAFHLEQAKREKQHPELVTGGEIPF